MIDIGKKGVSTHGLRPAVLCADGALIVSVDKHYDLCGTALDRHAGLSYSEDGISLITPADVETEYLTHAFVCGGRPYDQAVNVITG